MPKFRKKPVEVEASQWFKNGDHPDDYKANRTGFEMGSVTTFSGEHAKQNQWEGSIVRYFRHPGVPGEKTCEHCSKTMHYHGWIDTLEGGHIVCPGDFIITGVKGEIYPCDPEVFNRKYEPAQQHIGR